MRLVPPPSKVSIAASIVAPGQRNARSASLGIRMSARPAISRMASATPGRPSNGSRILGSKESPAPASAAISIPRRMVRIIAAEKSEDPMMWK